MITGNCYRFCNCIVERQDLILRDPLHRGRTLNFSTAGILRLLNGETIDLHEDDKQQIESLADEASVGVCKMARNKPGLWRFFPILLHADDIFLFAAFADALHHHDVMRDTTGAFYPWLQFDHLVPEAQRGQLELLPTVEQIVRGWTELSDRLRHIPRRVFLVFPTDFLTPTTPLRQRLKERLDTFQRIGVELFTACGWHVINEKNPNPHPDGYWAHYSADYYARIYSKLDPIIDG